MNEGEVAAITTNHFRERPEDGNQQNALTLESNLSLVRVFGARK